MNPYGLAFIMSIFGILIMRVQKRMMPKSYFYYARLIDGIDEEISFRGVIFRLIIPIIIGGLTALIVLYFRLSGDPIFFGSLASFGTIFLLVWPDILNPELISLPYKRKKRKLFTLYALLLVFFPFLGFSGAKFVSFIYSNINGILEIVDKKAIINNLLSNIVWLIGHLILSSIIIHFQVRRLRIQSTKSYHNGTASLDADGR
jgi:hypothetical protein